MKVYKFTGVFLDDVYYTYDLKDLLKYLYMRFFYKRKSFIHPRDENIRRMKEDFIEITLMKIGDEWRSDRIENYKRFFYNLSIHCLEMSEEDYKKINKKNKKR